MRGELMLQIASGRFFRPDVELHERIHRRTFYSNAAFLDPTPVVLPVGTIIGSTELDEISTATIEAIDRLEAQRPDGTDDILFATGGDDLIDDIAYVMTFSLNRTFSRDHGQVHRLVPGEGVTDRRRGAASLFPHLFAPRQIIQAHEIEDLQQFMGELLALSREDFVRVMRVIRSTVDATRRAIYDPTGAYTDLVAAMESLGEDVLTTPVTWDRYDGRKRKIIDAAVNGEDQALVEKVRSAVLEADRAGLKRRFVASTLARVSATYYRSEAVGTVLPPHSADLERMLGIAYDIRSTRSHVLEDLGDEAWVFTDGAETAFDPLFRRILTLAGLWRLVRHLVRSFVTDAPKTEPAPWDYRNTLPGIIQMQLAPQYWISQPGGFDAETARNWFNGVVEAFIAKYAGHTDEGFDLTLVVEKIEQLVPGLGDFDAKTAMVAIHFLWHEWTDPTNHGPTAQVFLEAHRACLDAPSATAFTLSWISNRANPAWTPDEWADLATARRAAREKGKEAPLPAAIDALIQLEAADQLEAAARHDEAVGFAANAVEESPGHKGLLAWEERLVARNHNPNFNVHEFLFGKPADAAADATEKRIQTNEPPTADGP